MKANVISWGDRGVTTIEAGRAVVPTLYNGSKLHPKI